MQIAFLVPIIRALTIQTKRRYIRIGENDAYWQGAPKVQKFSSLMFPALHFEMYSIAKETQKSSNYRKFINIELKPKHTQ